MLYLNPPFHVINGVSLLRDHKDILQYYFMPAAPRLTVLQDPVSKQRIPQFQLIQYRGETASGGFLNFDVNLGVEPEILNEVRSELQRLEKLRQLPKLAPLPLIGGTVKLMLLGQESGQPPAPVTTPRFVVRINQAANPALYGDNQAAFSVELDQAGVTILEKALQGEMSPVGIVYSLDYLALRPAYSVRLQIDWDRVQKHLNQRFSANVLFSSVEIDKTVDELVEQRAILLEADTFVPEGEDTSNIITRRDQALNDVREMITDAFFEPSLQPIDDKPDGWDKAVHTIERLSRLGTVGSAAGKAMFNYRKVDYTRIDRKSLNVNINERTTVKRSIYPQGHLSGFFRILRQQGLDPSKFIIPVDTDHPWFKRRSVRVISRANFEEDSIGSISANLRYGNDVKSVLLDPATTKGDVSWGSIVTNGVMQREVKASYKVVFKGVDSTERPLMLTSPEFTVETENLEITPRELYSVVPIPIMALAFPWNRYPTIEVQTRYADEANGIRITDTFLLDEKAAEKSWKLFLRDPKRQSFQYKLIFRAADHRDLEMPWVETEEERILIRDPRPNKRSLLVVPNFTWSEVKTAFVDVAYEDKANHVSQSDSFQFTETDDVAKTFVVDLVNPDVRQITYQMTVLYHDGRQAEIPRSVTRDRRIILQSDMQGHRIIAVRPAAADFTKKKVKEITVEIRYEDADAGISDADQFTFQSANDRAYFEFDYVDEHKASYEYRMTQRFTNGLSRSTRWQKVNADELVIPAG